jgi:hypothetical protein
MQREIDSIEREFPALGLSEHSFQGQKHAISEKGLPRFVAAASGSTRPPAMAF